MKFFVLDCSLTMGWCFEDEKSGVGDLILEDLKQDRAQGVVPSVWCLEVVNVLQVAEKRRRLPLAVRRQIPLANHDKKLKLATSEAGVPLYQQDT